MTELLPLLTYCFLMSSTPGPNNVMLTASGANFGYRGTLPHILGINVGDGAQTFATCLGLGALFVAWPVLHTVLRVAGALYLLVLAWQLAGSVMGERALPRPLSFWQAMGFQAVNPKSWIKAMTLASVFMPPALDVAAAARCSSPRSARDQLPVRVRCGRCSASRSAACSRRAAAARLQCHHGGASLLIRSPSRSSRLDVRRSTAASPLPLADQIETRLRALIEAGQLPAGARLLSIRALAAQLGGQPQHRGHRLRPAGRRRLDRVARHGRLLRLRVAPARSPHAIARSRRRTGRRSGWCSRPTTSAPACCRRAAARCRPSWLEDAIPAAVVQRGLARSAGGMAARCPPQGLPELRERIAMLMRSQGIAVDASRVLTTFGGTHAIDLICRAFLQPGRHRAGREPRLLPAVRPAAPGRRADGADRRGATTASTSSSSRPPARRTGRACCFVQSVLHNPTGWGSSAANLHRVLMLADRHGVLIAEDDVHGHFHPGPATRIAQLSELRGVIYYSSFCKALSPALRMGYIAAEPALLKPLMREKIHSVLTTAALNEFVLLELLASGRFRKHLDRLQRKLAVARVRRRAAAARGGHPARAAGRRRPVPVGRGAARRRHRRAGEGRLPQRDPAGARRGLHRRRAAAIRTCASTSSSASTRGSRPTCRSACRPSRRRGRRWRGWPPIRLILSASFPVIGKNCLFHAALLGHVDCRCPRAARPMPGNAR